MPERTFRGSLNSIRIIREVTCEDTWQLYVATALPALGTAMAVLLVPSPDEVLEEYLHPRIRRGQSKRNILSHGRQGRGRTGIERWLPIKWIPDVDSIIARLIPGSDYFAGRQVGGPEQWLWQGIDVLDRIAWYWLLLDIGENFVHYWASSIMRSEYCTAQAVLYFAASSSRDGFTGNTVLLSEANSPNVQRFKQAFLESDGQILPLINTVNLRTFTAVTLTMFYVGDPPTFKPIMTLGIVYRRGLIVVHSTDVPYEVSSGIPISMVAASEYVGEWDTITVNLESDQVGEPSSSWQAQVNVWSTAA